MMFDRHKAKYVAVDGDDDIGAGGGGDALLSKASCALDALALDAPTSCRHAFLPYTAINGTVTQHAPALRNDHPLYSWHSRSNPIGDRVQGRLGMSNNFTVLGSGLCKRIRIYFLGFSAGIPGIPLI